MSDSESDALSESESDNSARQEKALGLAKREIKGLAARTQTRLDFSPSDCGLGKAGEACKLVSS